MIGSLILMNHLNKVPLMEDMMRIMGGYRPKDQLFSLYYIINILFIFKFLITQSLGYYFHSRRDTISHNTQGYFVKNNNKSLRSNVDFRH